MNLPTLDRMLGIRYPIIVAPMFLISNVRMVVEALAFGATAAFPALNYRTESDLRSAIKAIKSRSDKPFGVNLIVNRSNPKYRAQLRTLLEMEVAYIITSLGNPAEVIKRCHDRGTKVFCDVVDVGYARKVEKLGADGLIAVNALAGGHAGNIEPCPLIQMLRADCSIPVISAGGIGRGQDLYNAMKCGAAGGSVGSLFIACEESEVSPEYKGAVVQYGENDIVKTDRLSGSPLTVINTPYVQEMGVKANPLERLLLRNKALRKYAKMAIAFRGMKAVKKAAMGATYKNVWCAGPAIEHVHAVLPVKEILARLVSEFDEARAISAEQ